MRTLRRIGVASIPLTFLFAGIGMLLLSRVDQSAGGFFQRIRSSGAFWVAAHIVLLFGTMLMVPAALSMRAAIHRRGAAVMGTVMVLVIAVTSVLLAGQYAIDFTVPLIADVGGDALTVHARLFDTPLINTLFYALPNLAFLALMLLSVAVVWGGVLSRVNSTVLMTNWAAVLLGNLIDPMFQRTAILMLAVSFMPLVMKLWGESIETVEQMPS